MGRKTWESLPKKPLAGRTNIVLTRDESFYAENAIVAHSFDEALALAGREVSGEIMIIGGAEIYAASLPRSDRVYLTEVHTQIDGDTKLPAFNRIVWRETAREDHSTPQGMPYSYVVLQRHT